MANEYIKADQIVEASMLLLQREIVLPRLVWRDFTNGNANAFRGALDDTVTLRVPAVMDARTRTLRSSTPLTADSLTETSVPVKLDTHVYKLLNITDEELTLDITDFARQVLAPQMRAVAEGMEDAIATELEAANWEADPITFTEGVQEPYDVAINARRALNLLNVPQAGRVLLLGANVEAAFLKSDKLSKVNESGTDDALRDATITKVGGFTVVGSNAIDPDKAFAFHQTAIAFANVTPALPEGATHKERIATDGLALRYIRDYNPTNSTGPVDRSLVDAFVGAASVEEANADIGNTPVPDSNRRGVEIEFTGDASA